MDLTYPAPNVKDIGGVVKLKISTETSEYESAISIHISCIRHDDSGQETILGSMGGYIIKREDMGFEEMDELSSDAENLVGTLFDEEGTLKAASKHDTGLFDSELEEGDILLVENTHVKKDYIRKGVGKSMVELALKHANEFYSTSWAFAWAVPMGLEPGEEEPASDRGKGGWYRTRSEDFFRAVGFRKVGRTHWLCYAMDPRHPSRESDAKEDSFNDYYQRLKGR